MNYLLKFYLFFVDVKSFALKKSKAQSTHSDPVLSLHKGRYTLFNSLNRLDNHDYMVGSVDKGAVRKTFDTLFIRIAFLNVIYNTRTPEEQFHWLCFTLCAGYQVIFTPFSILGIRRSYRERGCNSRGTAVYCPNKGYQRFSLRGAD